MTRSETGSTRSISTGSAGAGGCSPPPRPVPAARWEGWGCARGWGSRETGADSHGAVILQAGQEHGWGRLRAPGVCTAAGLLTGSRTAGVCRGSCSCWDRSGAQLPTSSAILALRASPNQPHGACL